MRILWLVLLAYGGFVVLVALFQNRLIYFPSRSSESDLIRAAGRSGLEPWRDTAGGIIGWRSVSSGPVPQNRILVFHGNAGSAVDRAYYVTGFQDLDDGRLWEIYLFEYPGYGARPGAPGEGLIQGAAKVAFDELRRNDPRPIFLLGESIGAGIACHLAGRFPDAVAGLCLITPFTTLADVAAQHYPFLPVRLLLRERYDCVAALRECRLPVAFVMAGKDEIVPIRLGRALCDRYSGPKRSWIQAEATHNSLDFEPGAPWWREVSDFLRGG